MALTLAGSERYRKDSKILDIEDKKVAFIACDVVYDELKDKIPANWSVVNLERKLHERSDELRTRLQQEIDKFQDKDLIILGYGLCGKGVEGLCSSHTHLVVSRCDDCIAMLLGSVEEYRKQHQAEPGTFYLTRGYIGDSDDFMIGEVEQIKDKYDEQTWEWIRGEMLKNYKRLVYINTGNYNPESCRELARKEAEKLGLRFEEIKGSNNYFDQMIRGDFDQNFVVLEPGQSLKFNMFINDN